MKPTDIAIPSYLGCKYQFDISCCCFFQISILFDTIIYYRESFWRSGRDVSSGNNTKIAAKVPALVQ